MNLKYSDLFIPAKPYVMHGRRSGRTTWMLMELVSALKEGQTHNKVVAASENHKRVLIDTFSKLAEPYFVMVRRLTKDVLVIDGELFVEFVVVSTGLPVTETWVDEAFPGYNGGVFVDHHTDGEE